MIDFRLRNEQVVAVAQDPATAVILLDIVLGYGSHSDPAGAIAPAIERAARIASEAGRTVTFVASVCGTDGDPQGLAAQESTLRSVGALLAPSNARAARLAARVASGESGADAPTPDRCAARLSAAPTSSSLRGRGESGRPALASSGGQA
jgi:FdrA protein